MPYNVTLVIPIKSDEQLQKIFAAEKALSDAGVTFDAGTDLVKNERHWELDWSLSGAEIKMAKRAARSLTTGKFSSILGSGSLEDVKSVLMSGELSESEKIGTKLYGERTMSRFANGKDFIRGKIIGAGRIPGIG